MRAREHVRTTERVVLYSQAFGVVWAHAQRVVFAKHFGTHLPRYAVKRSNYDESAEYERIDERTMPPACRRRC